MSQRSRFRARALLAPQEVAIVLGALELLEQRRGQQQVRRTPSTNSNTWGNSKSKTHPLASNLSQFILHAKHRALEAFVDVLQTAHDVSKVHVF
jgi:hypothetical protein